MSAPLRIVGSLLRRAGQVVDALGAGVQGRFASAEKGGAEKREGGRGRRPAPRPGAPDSTRRPPATTPVSAHRTLQPFAGAAPVLGAGVFVAPGASVVGDVTVGDRASIWYNAVLRGAGRERERGLGGSSWRGVARARRADPA